MVVWTCLRGLSGSQAGGGGAVVVWRVSLPLCAVLGHNILYIIVGFVWLSCADDGAAEEAITIRPGDGGYGYQIAALVCFVVFADNVLRRIEGQGENMLWVSSGRWELIVVSGMLSVLLQLRTGSIAVFWCGGVQKASRARSLSSQAFSSSAAKNALRVCRVWERSLDSWTELAYAPVELAYLSRPRVIVLSELTCHNRTGVRYLVYARLTDFSFVRG